MATCTNCGATLIEGMATTIHAKRKDEPPILLCPNCVAEAERQFQAETEEANLPGALLVGILAAIVSALIWYGVVVVTDYQLGILAIAVGWIVAQAVMLGAGRKRGGTLQVISVAITIGAMALSEYLIVRHFLIQAVIEEGYLVQDVPILLPLEDIWLLIVEGIKADPLTLLFWAIAVWEAFVIPAKRGLRKPSG